jgi:hypothetical protein
MELRRWQWCMSPCMVALVFCFLTAFSAYGADEGDPGSPREDHPAAAGPDRAQQKALKQLQGEVEAMKGRAATPTEDADNGFRGMCGSWPRPCLKKRRSRCRVKARLTVKLYGQVNKAVLYSNDGDKGNTYLVDNDNSSTRMGCWDHQSQRSL